MPYLIDYVENQFATFEEAPLNAVDAAVLSQLCMLSAEFIVPPLKGRTSFIDPRTILANPMAPRTEPARLHELLRAEHFSRMFTGFQPGQLKDLLFATAASPRFRDIEVSDYLSLFDVGEDTQFAAMVFTYKKLFSFVCFRGTDESVTGWKEDFNMAYSMPVPAQMHAAQYLSSVVSHLPGALYVGGHSKGGNLAEYAALKVDLEIQNRIRRVYILDGPGFKEGILTAEDYAPIIDRMFKIVPEDAIIGTLMTSPVELHVVPSNDHGFGQHSVFTWEIAAHEESLPEEKGEKPARPELGAALGAGLEAKLRAKFGKDAGTEPEEALDAPAASGAEAALALAAPADAVLTADAIEIDDGAIADDEEDSPTKLERAIVALEKIESLKSRISPAKPAKTIGLDFVYLDGLSDSAEILEATIEKWLARYDDEKRLQMVEIMFRTLEETGVDNVEVLFSDPSKTLSILSEAMRTATEEERELMKEAGRDMLEVAAQVTATKVTNGVKGGVKSGATKMIRALRDGAETMLEKLEADDKE